MDLSRIYVIMTLQRYGIQIGKRIPVITETNVHNHDYMQVKKLQMGHLI